MQLTWQQSIGLDDGHLTHYSDPHNPAIKVHRDLLAPLTQLFTAAEAAGLPIRIVSAYRDFNRQLTIWNDKWLGHRPVYSRHGRPLNVSQLSPMERYKAISLYSALPGMSRHHWGTDLDIFSATAVAQGIQPELKAEEFEPGGPCAELEQWLVDHLPQFGFFRPYQFYRQGVAAEPWHISYYPLASQILQHFDYDNHRSCLSGADLQAKAFILDQLPHYQRQYFTNLCEIEVQ